MWVIVPDMVDEMSDMAVAEEDLPLVDALQTNPRATPELVASVLGRQPRAVRRRMGRLLADGTIRPSATPRSDGRRVMALRLRVLQGKIDTVAAALARRSDVPFVDIAAGGEQIAAVMVAEPAAARQLVFRQLPATSAVVSVEAQPVLHVFADSSDWRVGGLSGAQRAALRPGPPTSAYRPAPIDAAIVDELVRQPRAPATEIARRLGAPASTVRRRLHELLGARQVVLQTFVDPVLLGLHVDAGIWMRVAPARLRRCGTALAAHPAVHGAFASAGSRNLYAAVWLEDAEALFGFITDVLGGLDVEDAEAVVVGRAVKRPGRDLGP